MIRPSDFKHLRQVHCAVRDDGQVEVTYWIGGNAIKPDEATPKTTIYASWSGALRDLAGSSPR